MLIFATNINFKQGFSIQQSGVLLHDISTGLHKPFKLAPAGLFHDVYRVCWFANCDRAVAMWLLGRNNLANCQFTSCNRVVLDKAQNSMLHGSQSGLLQGIIVPKINRQYHDRAVTGLLLGRNNHANCANL